jgi:putative SOS response-associated peptidase YedK
VAETVHLKPMFREAYERRRCIVPIDGFFEWKAIKGKAKQPYAIAMKDRSPFGVAGLWENWKSPSGEWVRTFAIITTDSNELVGQIHDRMPVILHRADYERWLGADPDPRDTWAVPRWRWCHRGTTFLGRCCPVRLDVLKNRTGAADVGVARHKALAAI